MTCNDTRNPNDKLSNLLMSTRICIPIHNRRFYRCSPSKFISWHCITWHLLFSSTLPLCSINRSSICNHGRICSVMLIIHWTYNKPKMTKGSIRCYICTSKFNIFPATFPRTSRNNTAIFRKSRRYTTWNIILSIRSTSSFVGVLIFLFII